MDDYPGRDPEPEAAEAPPDDRGEVVPLPTRPDRADAPERPLRPETPSPIREHEKAVREREAALRSHFETLCEAERTTLRAETLKANPNAPRFGETWIEDLMIAAMERANRGRYPEIPEPTVPLKQPEPPKLSPLARFEADFLAAYRARDRQQLYAVALGFAASVGDGRSDGMHRRIIDWVLADRLKPSEYLDAHRVARGPGVVRPGALFTAAVTAKLRPEAQEKTALGAIRQDLPESGQV